MKLYLSSKIFQKALAALSGGFLILFLIGHLAGNLQLFIPGDLGQKQFNTYACFIYDYEPSGEISILFDIFFYFNTFSCDSHSCY